MSDIEWTIDADVVTLTINRPDKLNALSNATADELRAAVGEIEAHPDARAVVLTGAGRGFGAGYDLPAVDLTKTPQLDDVLNTHFNPLVRQMRQSRLPFVAAVNGPCAGGSIGVALSADIVIAGRSAFFYEPFIGLGLVPDVGNTIFMTRLAGRIRASAAMLLGDRITAEEAREWGLVWKVTDDDTLMQEATATARRLASGSADAIAATKALIHAASDPDLSAMLDRESAAQGILGRGEEMRAAFAAFAAKAKKA
ncbi:hypothetical protein BOO69_20810 (plasmid) [Sulfitobacter alexandrii]|uniref:2-(1,2-epoxy-1,2-dihydrophenyl)acetyl-CoA isomerase n=1 Tax=Sulfitobacter alexandrii TaxID=1917485 RepID=A0A1J0WNX8_9RHOB|nr:enoyl-CoA hydratase-related protein [Sulfitobacter alexandrii]APE45997.1 hypothetical protein BOO69_20810 [Sulfitobacter alexandrii]